jgi:hypothetical protein
MCIQETDKVNPVAIGNEGLRGSEAGFDAGNAAERETNPEFNRWNVC